MDKDTINVGENYLPSAGGKTHGGHWVQKQPHRTGTAVTRLPVITRANFPREIVGENTGNNKIFPKTSCRWHRKMQLHKRKTEDFPNTTLINSLVFRLESYTKAIYV